MNHKALILAIAAISSPLFAADNEQLQREIRRLQQQTKALEVQLNKLQKKLVAHPEHKKSAQKSSRPQKHAKREIKENNSRKPEKATTEVGNLYHTSVVSAHTPPLNTDAPDKLYPTALLADNRVLTYIAGTPVVSSPYTGDMPAFDGSDYIVNISSINRDIRLMEQRRKLYKVYEDIGYHHPDIPILALSGKLEPLAIYGWPYVGSTKGDLTLGSTELDIAAALNHYVEAFMSIAYDDSPPQFDGQRIANSSFDLNLGFINIGNLDKSPVYFTAGQLYAPYGRYSSAMISSPLTLRLARTKTRPFILGYKSKELSGPYAAAYAFNSDTTQGRSGVGGVNFGYIINSNNVIGDIGGGYIGSLADSQGLQHTGAPGSNFGGFGSFTNGSEAIGGVPGVDFHVNLSIDRYNFAVEWVSATRAFSPMDLSFNGQGAKPSAAQLEAGVTFMSFNKPSSVAMGYQWAKDTLALYIPERRISAVYNISIWKDTVESLEYRHDIDYGSNTYANGISAPGKVNTNTIGTGAASDTIFAQIGVYF